MIFGGRLRALAVAVSAGPVILGGCAAGSGPVATDGGQRTAIVLSAREAEEFRSGMRAYLEASQNIVDGVRLERMARVKDAARKTGMGAVTGVSPSLALRLPAEFVALSLDTHRKFDEIAQAAERNAGAKQILGDLSAVQSNCIACHSTYRLSIGPG